MGFVNSWVYLANTLSPRIFHTLCSYRTMRPWPLGKTYVFRFFNPATWVGNDHFDAELFNRGSGPTASKYAHALNCYPARSGLKVSFQYDYVFPMGFLAPPV